jgi:hypothetical protein
MVSVLQNHTLNETTAVSLMFGYLYAKIKGNGAKSSKK